MVRFQKKDGSIVEIEDGNVESFKVEFPEAVVIKQEEVEKQPAEEIKTPKTVSPEYVSSENIIIEENKQIVDKVQKAIKFGNDLKYGKRDNYRQWEDVDINLDNIVDDGMGSFNKEISKVDDLYDKLDLVDVAEGAITDVFNNLQKLDIINEDNKYAGSYSDQNQEIQDEIRDTAWLNTREQSGMNITKESFNKIFFSQGGSGKFGNKESQTFADKAKEKVQQKIDDDLKREVSQLTERDPELLKKVNDQLKKGFDQEFQDKITSNARLIGIGDEGGLIQQINKVNKELKGDLGASERVAKTNQLVKLQTALKLVESNLENIKAGGYDENQERKQEKVDSALFTSNGFTEDQIVNAKKRAEKNELIRSSEASARSIGEQTSKSNPGVTPWEAMKNLTNDSIFEGQLIQQEGEKILININTKELGGPGQNVNWTHPLLQKLNQEGMFAKDGNIKVSAAWLTRNGFVPNRFEGVFDNYFNHINEKDLLSFKIYSEQVTDNEAKTRGFYNATYLNLDVKDITKSSSLENFVDNSIKAIATSWLDMTPTEIEAKLGKGRGGEAMGLERESIDRFSQIVNNYNSSDMVQSGEVEGIKINDEQAEVIGETLMEEVSANLGAFVPMLAEFAIVGGGVKGVMAASGLARTLANVSTKSPVGKLINFGAYAMLEEGKMQLAFDFAPGAGAMFYAGGVATSGISPFAKRFKWMDPFFQKVLKAGPVGAMSSEGAELFSTVYEDMMDNRVFATEFDKHFGDLSEVGRRMLVNTLVFSIAGIHNVKSTDLMSTGQNARNRYRVIGELDGKMEKILPGSTKKFSPKEFEKLSPENQKTFEAYNEGKSKMIQLVENETRHIKLNPESKNFEVNFKKMVVDPYVAGIKRVVPEFQGFDMIWGEGKAFRKTYGFSETGTAKYLPSKKGKKALIALDKNTYTAGKSVHEFTHAAINAQFEAHPELKKRFTEKMSKIFEGFDFNGIGSKELQERIQKVEGIDPKSVKLKDLAKTAEEYLAYMGEFLTNPQAYYGANGKLASTFLNEVRLEVKDMLIESGIRDGVPKTAKDVVELFALLGKSTRMGSSIENKASALAQLEGVNILGFKLQNTGKETIPTSAESKDLFQRTDKVFNETKELFKENDKSSKLYKDWANEIERRLKNINLPEGEKVDIARNFISGKRGLKGLVKEFDQAKLDKTGTFTSLSAYLNNKGKSKKLAPLIDRRLLEFFEKNPRYKNIVTSISNEGFKELSGDLGSSGSKEKVTVGKDLAKELDRLIPGSTMEQKLKERIKKDFDPKTIKGKSYKTLENEAKDIVSDFINKKSFVDKNGKTITENRTLEEIGRFLSKPTLGKLIYELGFPQGYSKLTGKATIVNPQSAAKKAFYVKSDMKLNATLGKSTAGLFPLIKQRFNQAKWNQYVERQPGERADTYRKRIEDLTTIFSQTLTNQSKTQAATELLKTNPDLRKYIETVADGKAEGLESKYLGEFEGQKLINKKNNFVQGLNIFLTGSDKEKENLEKNSPDLIKNIYEFFVDLNQGVAKEGKSKQTNFKKELGKDLIKEDLLFDTTPQEIRDLNVDFIISKKNGKTIIDQVKAEKFTNAMVELAERLPAELANQKGLLKEILGLHQGVTLEGETRTENKKGARIENKLGDDIVDAQFTKTYERVEKALGKNVDPIFDGLNLKINTAPTQATNFAKSLGLKGKERENFLKKYVSLADNVTKSELYNAIQTTKQNWLSSSKDKKSYLDTAEAVASLERYNTNLRMGLRQLVPITAVYMPKGKIITFEKGKTIDREGKETGVKLEHLKAMVTQSIQATNAMISGKWSTKGKDIMKDFTGILSLKSYLDIIDKKGGTTNTSGLARMTLDLENLKDYYTVESGFKTTLYEKLIAETSQKLGAKTRELGLNFLENQVARYVANNTPTNKVILEQALNNKKEAKKVFVNNLKLAKAAGVKESNNAEMIVELGKKDKENAKKVKEGFESKDLNKEFNQILEQSSGVAKEKEFSDIRARTIGKKKRKWQLFIPDSAADLNGLIDVTLGKGKKGNAQRKWYKENLIDPFNKAENALITDRVALTSGFKALKKQLKVVPKDLRKEAIEGFTFEQAIRVHTWNKQGMKIEGLSKRDLKELSEIIEKNPELNAFSEQLIELGKGEGYPAPPKEWLAGSIATDLRTGLNKGGRAKYLEATGYTENVNKIYSKENLNKLEALYGTKYRVAIENMLGRMKTGINRKPSANALENRALDWINNANGVTMFLNARSAVLQTISSLNYINWTDNNPLRAGKAVANQPQYWKDFMEIMNSDYLVDRRNGLKLNVSESEIADAAKSSTNSAKGAINYLLSKGFMFTRIADSFAIASGGSTFYRNRINTYKKQGLSEAQAKEKAFVDFKEISEVSQQSANVSKISMEQSSALGRLVLAFANTPMQYARLQKSAIKDLANGRGDYKSNISKVMYYGFVQNLMFNALQNALFTNIWEDNPDEAKEDMKKARIANGMADSILRGMGIGGAGVSTIKNVLLKIKSESNKSRPKYEAAALEVFDFLPPIDSKVRKLLSAGRSMTWDAKEMRNTSLMDPKNPAYLAGANVISAATNFPADRIVKKVTNMQGVMTDEMEMWQRIARFAGWSEWEIGPQSKKSSGKPRKVGSKGKKVGKKR